MTTELVVAILGFATAVVGLITALVGRKREVVQRRETDAERPGSSFTSVGWLGILIVGVGLAILLGLVVVAFYRA